MRALAICALALGLLGGTTAMAAGGNNGNSSSSSTAANTPAPAEPANSSPAGNANAAATPSPNVAGGASPAEERIATELESLRGLIEEQSRQIQQQSEELKEQREKTAALEKQLSALSAANGNATTVAASAPAASAALAPTANGTNAPSANATLSPSASSGTSAANQAVAAQAKTPEVSATFDNDFHFATADNKYTMNIHGLFQPRFTEFVANSDAKALGAPPTADSDFDIYLGRLAFYGSAFDPSIKYFVQFQGSTSTNTNNVFFLDWFAQKEFSPELSVQMGRSWTPYSYENFLNPGNFMFPDFSVAEYAFALSRSVNFEATGQAGKLGYALMITDSVPGLDAGAQENFNNKLGFIGHVQYDILAPYGYEESAPEGASSPELSIWSSAAYNPVNAASALSNQTAGDRTVGATTTVGFRDGWFSLQSTGFYRRTLSDVEPNFNAWGYSEQAGYYLVPKRVEIDGRISGVLWDAPDFLGFTPGVDVNTWYAGPNFPYHRITEHSVGFNYYLYGHNAKIQTAYSYMTGNTFTDKGFAASRVWIQAQVMF
jgi:hypothetical protein